MSKPYDENFGLSEDVQPEYIDIDATVETIRAAWKCVPDLTLSEMLDIATPAPFCVMTNEELIQALNEFILQNQ